MKVGDILNQTYFLLTGLPSGSSRLRPLIIPLSILAVSELVYSVKSKKLNLPT